MSDKFSYGEIMYDGELCYYACHEHSHRTIILDHDEGILGQLKEIIDKNDKIYPQQAGNKTILKFYNLNGRNNVSMSSVIYALYNGGQDAVGRVYRLNTEPGEYFDDCRSTMLYDSGLPQPEMVARTVKVEDDKIIVDCHGIVNYFSYNDSLYRFLSSTSCHAYTCGNKIKFEVQSGGRRERIFAAPLAYLCYTRQINPDGDMLDQLEQLTDRLIAEDITIDHLNGDQRNNFVWNLSPMSRATNTSKRDCFARFRSPYAVGGAYIGDGKYLIEFLQATDAHTVVHVPVRSRFIVDGADDLNQILHAMASLDWDRWGDDDVDTVRRSYLAQRQDTPLCQDLEWAEVKAEELMQAWQTEPEKFIHWERQMRLIPDAIPWVRLEDASA